MNTFLREKSTQKAILPTCTYYTYQAEWRFLTYHISFSRHVFFEFSGVALWRQPGDSKMYVYRGSLTRLNLSTKVRLKTIHFQIVAVSRPCIRFFSFRYCFKGLSECSLAFVVSRSKLL